MSFEVREWKEIEGYSRYMISTNGEVLDTKEDRLVPQCINGNFYCCNLVDDAGKKVLCKVHRFVAIAYIGNPENAHNVVHRDGDRSNNSVDNLFWKPKKVKEVVEKEVKTLTFQNHEYTYEDFSSMVGCEISLLKGRLKSGWSVRECFTGIKEFSGQGYEDETHWFPNKKQMEQHRIEQSKLLAKLRKEQRELEKNSKSDRKKYGVGVFVNHPVQGIINRTPTKTYRVWDGMLGRCYGENKDSYAAYGAVGVRVCEEWHEFQNFAVWYEGRYQDNDWHIDKDILCPKEIVPVYCPEYCVLVPPEINTFFATLPSNVSASFSKGWYRTSLSIFGKKVNFSSKDRSEVIKFYWDTKRNVAKALADKYEGQLDERVVSILRNIPTQIIDIN